MRDVSVMAFSWLSVADFRRWVAVLCVTIFVFSLVTHKAHDDNTVFNASPSHVANVLSSHAPDAPAGDIKADATHCHACVSAYLPIGHDVGPTVAPVAELVTFVPTPLFASGARPDFPPPKA